MKGELAGNQSSLAGITELNENCLCLDEERTRGKSVFPGCIHRVEWKLPLLGWRENSREISLPWLESQNWMKTASAWMKRELCHNVRWTRVLVMLIIWFFFFWLEGGGGASEKKLATFFPSRIIIPRGRRSLNPFSWRYSSQSERMRLQWWSNERSWPTISLPSMQNTLSLWLIRFVSRFFMSWKKNEWKKVDLREFRLRKALLLQSALHFFKLYWKRRFFCRVRCISSN